MVLKKRVEVFFNAFGCPLKFALLYDVLKLHKEYVFD